MVKEELKLKVFEIRSLRKVFGALEGRGNRGVANTVHLGAL